MYCCIRSEKKKQKSRANGNPKFKMPRSEEKSKDKTNKTKRANRKMMQYHMSYQKVEEEVQDQIVIRKLLVVHNYPKNFEEHLIHEQQAFQYQHDQRSIYIKWESQMGKTHSTLLMQRSVQLIDNKLVEVNPAAHKHELIN